MINKTFVIGRHGDIRIDDDSVSKRHAEFQLRNNQIYVRALDSTNGLYVQFNQMMGIGRKAYRISEILERANHLSFEFKYYRCA